MADDERPPKRRHQTQTERDFSALTRLREERKRAQSKAELELGEEETPVVPRNEFDREIDTSITQRIQDDPDLNRLFDKIESAKRNLQAAIVQQGKTSADQVLAVAGERPPAERFSKIERGLRIVHLVVFLIAVPAITSMIMLGRYFYARGGLDAAADFQRQQETAEVKGLEGQVLELSKQLNQLHDDMGRIQQRQDDLARPSSRGADSAHKRDQ